MNEMAIDLIGHVAYALIILGTILVARKQVAGWPLRVAGEIIWIALGIALGLTSIWFWEIVFVCIGIYGWRKWSAGDKD